MALELRILGPVEATDDGVPIDLGTAKERALMALLALNAGRVVSSERLAEDLWEGEPPPQAAATLRVYVSHLRKALGDDGAVIKTRKPGYLLELALEALDASRFEATSARARTAAATGDDRRAAALFREALELWRGPALADVADQSFARAEAIRLEEARLAVVEDRIDSDLRLGAHADLVGELEVLTSEQPLRERLWRHLITALYRSGRQADALAAHRKIRQRLADELGIDPGPELQELERRILAQDPALNSVPVRETARDVRLPAYRTTFFGRDDEIETLTRRLEKHQLVTVTGVGGCGKTRMAVEAARGLVDGYADGVYFIDLGSVADPDLVPQIVATGVGVSGGGVTGGSSRPVMDDVVALLRGRSVLIVLDNCEHLLEASAQAAEMLLQASRGLRMIATSREPLGIDDEQVLAVPSLEVPGERDQLETDSVRLFADRAQAARTGFELNAENIAAVADICRRLDGIPLAIELAAARVAHLSPGQIAERLNDRFRLLTGGRRRIQRQQTLQATMDWSYDLLDENERTVLRRLSVFPSDFSLEAAEAVGVWGLPGSALDLMGSLVAKSMASLEERSGIARYRLPETVRLYAEERLAATAEGDATRTRHLDHFVSAIERISAEILDPTGFILSGLAGAEYANLAAALLWADVSEQPAKMARILAQTRLLWWFVGSWEAGMDFYDRALSFGDRIDRRSRLSLLSQSAGLAVFSDDFIEARRRAKEAIELGRDDDGYAMIEALFIHGQLLAPTDPEGARICFDRAMLLAEGEGPIAQAALLVQRGEAAMAWGEYALARDSYEAATSLAPDFYMTYWGRAGTSLACHLLGEDQDALRWAVDSVARTGVLMIMQPPPVVLREATTGFQAQEPFLNLLARFSHALALTGVERLDDATQTLREHLTITERTRIPGGIETSLIAFAAIALQRGESEKASRLLAKAASGIRNLSAGAALRHYVRLVRQALDQETAHRCRDEGLAMTIDEALAYALEP